MSDDPYRTSAKPFVEPPPKRTAAEKRKSDIDHYWSLQMINSNGKTAEQLAKYTRTSDDLLRRISQNLYEDDK